MEVGDSTRGQSLAFDQLKDIEESSDGLFEIASVNPPEIGGDLRLRVSIDTKQYPRAEGGFKFRDREPINIFVPSRFPIAKPRAEFAHKRFLGFPHVNWGDCICVYLSPDVEWAATDGMFGFVQRLSEWLADAAQNKLAPEDAPLHPPVAYGTNDRKLFIDVDAPEIEPSKGFWLGTAKLVERNKVCFNLTGWSDLPTSFPRGERYAAALLLNQPMPMEYPDTVSALFTILQDRGIPFDLLFSTLKVFALCQNEDDDIYFVLGAPMRRLAAGEPLRQHLTAWSIDAKYAKALRVIVADASEDDVGAAWQAVLDFATEAKTNWCTVYDGRPELTFRRDVETNASWLLGKHVAILGCGAIGSHMAEYVARAGAAKMTLVDNSTVKPGILVRQQFDDWVVGYTKESALKLRLNAIMPSMEAVYFRQDLRKGLPDKLTLEEVDLVIDATASRHVAAALQEDLQEEKNIPPILSCSIDGLAANGLATLRTPNSVVGAYDISRLTKLVAHNRAELSTYASAFWPTGGTKATFQPEPGCSDPTFVGSAADVAFFASSFFDFCMFKLLKEDYEKDVAFFISKENQTHHGPVISSKTVQLPKLEALLEGVHGYRICLTEAAKQSIQAEIKRNAREGSNKDETGGLLLGEVDDTHSTVFVDIASGAPPDSQKSPERFECGVQGAKELCEFHANKTSGSTNFIGVWHTHPVSLPDPSTIDLAAMANILHLQEKTPRQVVMLIIGFSATKPTWQFHLFRRNQFKIMGMIDD